MTPDYKENTGRPPADRPMELLFLIRPAHSDLGPGPFGFPRTNLSTFKDDWGLQKKDGFEPSYGFVFRFSFSRWIARYSSAITITLSLGVNVII